MNMKNNKDLEILQETLLFWNKLSDSQKNLLAEHTTSATYEKNSSIHNADYQCIGLLLVKSGSLRVYMLSDEGREITLYRIQKGEACVLSASCVLESITFDVFIDAVSDSEVIQVNSSAVSFLMEENIYAEAYAYKLVTERFSDVMWAMQQILFMSFDRRLAIFLLDESNSLQSDEIQMTHEQIARLMGSAREVVTRMLKYFSSEGYVALSRGSVKLINKKELQKII